MTGQQDDPRDKVRIRVSRCDRDCCVQIMATLGDAAATAISLTPEEALDVANALVEHAEFASNSKVLRGYNEKHAPKH